MRSLAGFLAVVFDYFDIVQNNASSFCEDLCDGHIGIIESTQTSRRRPEGRRFSFLHKRNPGLIPETKKRECFEAQVAGHHESECDEIGRGNRGLSGQ